MHLGIPRSAENSDGNGFSRRSAIPLAVLQQSRRPRGLCCRCWHRRAPPASSPRPFRRVFPVTSFPEPPFHPHHKPQNAICAFRTGCIFKTPPQGRGGKAVPRAGSGGLRGAARGAACGRFWVICGHSGQSQTGRVNRGDAVKTLGDGESVQQPQSFAVYPDNVSSMSCMHELLYLKYFEMSMYAPERPCAPHPVTHTCEHEALLHRLCYCKLLEERCCKKQRNRRRQLVGPNASPSFLVRDCCRRFPVVRPDERLPEGRNAGAVGGITPFQTLLPTLEFKIVRSKYLTTFPTAKKGNRGVGNSLRTNDCDVVWILRFKSQPPDSASCMSNKD